MPVFCWRSERRGIPLEWDLRRLGWRLCEMHAHAGLPCNAVTLVDAQALGEGPRHGCVRHAHRPMRLILLGVDSAEERAMLLEAGCGEVLPGAVELPELTQRARRLAERARLIPREKMVGPLMLDLVHRDGRIGSRWLALHPREFELLWRLAENPGRSVSRGQLLQDVWRLRHEPETNSLEVHVCRLRIKLAAFGLSGLVETDPAGGYRLLDPEMVRCPGRSALDGADQFCDDLPCEPVCEKDIAHGAEICR